MSSIIPDLTSRFFNNEVSGDSLDSLPAGHDATVSAGATRNGNSITFDGVGEKKDWPFGDTPFDPSDSHTGYLDLTIDNQYDGSQKYFVAPNDLKTDESLLVRWRGDGGKRQIDVLTHGSAGLAIVTLLFSRLFNIGERVIILWSYDIATKVLNAVVVSDQGIDESGTNTGTQNPAWTSPNRLQLFQKQDGGDFTNVTLNEDGYIDGTARSIADLQDTAAELLASPPVLDNPIPDQEGIKNQLFDFTFAENTFSDPEDEDLTYTATLDGGAPLPSWLTFTPATRNFNGTPLFADIGAIDIEVTATNESLLFVSDVFELDVIDNDPPVVDNPIADQQVNEGSQFNFTVPANTFSDPDGDDLVLSATLDDDSPLPAWLDFNPGTETFTGLASHDDIGTINIKVTATDPSAQSVFDIFELEVTPDFFAKIKNMFTAFRALLPDGRVWNIDLSIQFRQVIEAISSSLVDVKEYFITVKDNPFPDSTQSLELWEEQFALDPAGLTDQERRDQLEAAWASTGGQSPTYLESIILKLGIVATVYENFDRDDPTSFLIGGDSEILVNGEILFERRDGTTSCGSPEMSCDNPEASCGAYTGFSTTTKEYPISPYSEKWVYYFIVADPASAMTPLDVPASLEFAFKLAILRIKPVNTRAVLNVNYV